ncbi:MAG: insulinase family protein [Acidobacteria bacterium]|nr:insulinase family protein [Acidobacteriota bacterium]
MNRIRSLAVAALLLAAPVTVVLAAGSKSAVPSVPLTTFTLDNGLKVVLSEDHAFPVIAYSIDYAVGSRAEPAGRSGFAHLFEHMMFQGTPNVGKGEYFKYVESNGGIFNGSTHEDYTNYYAELPAHRLELAIWLEADRMRSLAINAENLKNQQEAVKEEKRLGIDNQPYADALANQLTDVAFKNYANRHSTIGSFDDLNAASVKDVQDFFTTYYAPNNATLVLVGDFDPAEAKRLIVREFGSIPRQPSPIAVDSTEPPAGGEVRRAVKDVQAPTPGVVIAWRGPARSTTDYYALALLQGVLFEGNASRLYQDLVKGKEVAVSIQGDMGMPLGDYVEYRSPGLYGLFVIYKPSIDANGIVSEVQSEIDRIAKEGVPADELERAKVQFRSKVVRGLTSTLDRATRLGIYAAVDGDASRMTTDIPRFLDVSSSDIRQAAASFLVASNRVVIEIQPAPAGATPAAAGVKEAK